jgi:hypothetical protein
VTLIVEDGAGRADAESYVDLSSADVYATAHGLTFPIDPAEPAERALRRATSWIDGVYRTRFTGFRKELRVQALEWPRRGAYDIHGYPIGESELPRELIAATIEAAVRELATPGVLTPDITPGKLKSQVSVGDISVTYALGSGVQDQRMVMTVIDQIMSALICGSPSPMFGSTVRT